MADAALAAPARPRVSARPAVLEAAAVVALVVLAALVRWPNYLTVPPFTDETEEALRAWAIAQGEIRPLTNIDAYIGALWGYLVAGAFTLFGRHPEVPRLMSLLAGSLTVGATYLLGRGQFGRVAGGVAALLMAGNAAHVLVNSHVAWSNCATPLFTTVAFWLLVRAVREPRGLARWAWAGLAWGLALQTHPSVAAFLLGGLAYAFAKDRRLLLRPGVWVLGALLLAGYANVLLYNVQTGFDTLVQARRVGSEYAEGAGLDAYGYTASLAGVVVLLVQALAGVVEPHATVGPYLLSPLFLLFAVLTVGALAWSARRGEPLALLAVLAALAILPVLNQRWSPILASRYLMPLVPVCLVAIGGLAQFAAAQLVVGSAGGHRGRVRSSAVVDTPVIAKRSEGSHARVPTTGQHEIPRRTLLGMTDVSADLDRSTLLPFGAALLIAAVQLAGLWAYYGVELAAGRSNEGALRMVRLVEARRQDREPFAVHADLHRLPMGGGGDWAKVANFFLELEGVRKDVSPRDPNARVRACDVTAVELRHVRRDAGERRRADEPSSSTYWIVRQVGGADDRRAERGEVVETVPYSLPWRNRSLFDARVPTFETGCE